MGDNTIYSDFVMAAVTDDFFRWYTNWEMASWADGQVDAPTGWFAVCNIDRSDVAEYAAESGDPTISRHIQPTPGWFLVQIDNLKTHPSVAAALAHGEVNVYGWVYRIETGEVFAYDPAQARFLPLGANHEPDFPVPIPPINCVAAS